MEPRSKHCGQAAGVAVVVLGLLCSTYGEYYRHVPADTRYSTSQCDSEWCGEKWRSDRILYYGHAVTFVTEERNVTVAEITRNCSNSTGATVHSTQCELAVNSTGRTEQVHNVTVKHVTRYHQRTISLPESLSLGIILTDNIGIFGNLSQETYPPNQDKIWQIKIPKSCRMVIYFQEFDIEPSNNCEKDYFTIQTSKSQPNIRKYCNSLHEVEFRYRRRVQLWFHSDDTVTKRGIYAALCLSNWPPVEGQRPCSCNIATGSSRRRARSSWERRQHRQAERNQRQEDREVGRWLANMMRNGQPAVDRYLRYYEDVRQRYLAESFQEAVNDWTLQNPS